MKRTILLAFSVVLALVIGIVSSGSMVDAKPTPTGPTEVLVENDSIKPILELETQTPNHQGKKELVKTMLNPDYGGTGVGSAPNDRPVQKIPEWVRNVFVWYAQEQVSEAELLNAIKYLVQQDIIKLD
jgi:hypothetical protein